jgi:hypothetical protein
MGGFNPALPTSGNDSDFNVTPARAPSDASNSLDMPAPNNDGGNWTSQAWQPSSAMTQPIQGSNDEQIKNADPVDTGWTPKPTQQQATRDLQDTFNPPDPTWPKPQLDTPKMPKIDWTIYGDHRINGNTRVMHEDWARIINSTKDFGGIIPTFLRHIDTNGDVGRGDAADMIGRVAQTNPDHARFFQGELSKALGG